MAMKLCSFYRGNGANNYHTLTRSTTIRLPSITTLSWSRLPCHAQKRQMSMKELDIDQDGRERVVILGSGWAGYALATTLNPKRFQAVVVSPRSYFVFTPLLAESACGTIELRTTVEPIRGKRLKARYIQAWADAVDFTKKSITVEDAVLDPEQGLALTKTTTKNKSRKGTTFQVKYDKLVIAVGCYLETFNTLGVKEHARFLKDVGDARKIRRRVLECFEIAASPASTEDIRRQILHFAIVGGGPTGIEYAATLHDLIFEDLRHLYPELMEEVSITVYDVAPNVLSMFDTKLAEYAQQTLKRENIKVRTSRHIVSLEPGLPGQSRGDDAQGHPAGILTLTTKEEGAEGVGMCVWATGLAQNPFVESCFTAPALNPNPDIISTNDTQQDATTQDWKLAKHEKTGSIITDQQLRVLLEPTSSTSSASKDEAAPRATLKDVFAMGDCAITQNTSYPATAQVASQKAYWLAARLNKNDLDNNNNKFEWKNLGTMAYLGGWTGIAQGIGGLGDVSGRTAWIIWKGAYLVKTLSWRNRILVLVYWCTNWASGRDVSRF